MFNPDPPSSHRFMVDIDGVTAAVFTECELPSFEITTDAEIQEGGRAGYTIQLPGPLKPGRVSLKRGLVLADKLLDWYFDIVQWKFHKGGLYKDVTVTLYKGYTAALTIGFINAYPGKWQGPSLKADTTAVAVDSIDFIYETMDIEKGTANLMLDAAGMVQGIAGRAMSALSAGLSVKFDA